MEVSPLPDIPIDIIRLILLKLRVKSLIRFQGISKQWHSIIQDPDFKSSYRGQRRLLVVSDESIRDGSFTVRSITSNLCVEKNFIKFGEHLPILGTINQLRFLDVCCSYNGFVVFNIEEHIFLWNPSIRSCIKVLELRQLRYFGNVINSGLCYDSFTEDYKVVLVFRGSRVVLVAGLRDKKWRPVPLPYNLYTARANIEFRGILYWIASDIQRCNKIVYFDPKCDEFKDLPMPEPRLEGREDKIIGLGVIDNCICMAREVGETLSFEVLVIEENIIEESSWVKKFVIPILKFTPLHFLKNNSKLLIWNRRKIYVYDLKENKLENFFKKSIYEFDIGICFHVESFASPSEFIWREMMKITNTVQKRSMIAKASSITIGTVLILVSYIFSKMRRV